MSAGDGIKYMPARSRQTRTPHFITFTTFTDARATAISDSAYDSSQLQ
jgi:hypothetical protein